MLLTKQSWCHFYNTQCLIVQQVWIIATFPSSNSSLPAASYLWAATMLLSHWWDGATGGVDRGEFHNGHSSLLCRARWYDLVLLLPLSLIPPRPLWHTVNCCLPLSLGPGLHHHHGRWVAREARCSPSLTSFLPSAAPVEIWVFVVLRL